MGAYVEQQYRHQDRSLRSYIGNQFDPTYLAPFDYSNVFYGADTTTNNKTKQLSFKNNLSVLKVDSTVPIKWSLTITNGQ